MRVQSRSFLAADAYPRVTDRPYPTRVPIAQANSSIAPPIPARFIARERRWLNALHDRWHDRAFVEPDPLQFLYRYEAPDDREVAGLIASSLAYGNVKAMLRAIDGVLISLGPAPACFLDENRPSMIASRLRGFRYRFTTGEQLAGLLLAARAVRRMHGSIGMFLAAHARDHDDESILPAVGAFVDAMRAASGAPLAHLLPHPADGSACKRLMLYLRWMVRADEIDPGGWTGINRSRLIIPLDTHVHRTALARGWTDRRSADGRTAIAITRFLRRVNRDDPLRYDFAITRPGIRRERK